MSQKETFITKLIYQKDKADPEKFEKGKFFVGSTILFILLCLTSIPYYGIFFPEEITKHPDLFLVNIIGAFFIFALLFIYRKFGGRIFIVNAITFLGYAGNYGTYSFNGGIFSPDNMWGIIISCWVFLVANRLSGFIWMIVSTITLIFFYYADLNQLHDFQADIMKVNSGYYFLNYILAALFLLAIISLYESSKRKFVNELKDSKTDLELHRKELEAQREDILASINYAKRIQHAVLPNEENIYRNIPLSFIFYKPKDIVSGDFFWFHEIDRDNYIYVCADCTGHGVPGALMTVIGSNLLTQIVIENKTHQPSQILNELDKRLASTLKQQKEHYKLIQDGMDVSVLSVDKSKKQFTYTGAKRPAVLIKNKEITELKGSKFSLGGYSAEEKVFEEIKINYNEDDVIYLFTDGYIDQFGGIENKKYMIKKLRELLLKIHVLPMQEQKQILEKTIVEWTGKNDQTDNILVTGIRF